MSSSRNILRQMSPLYPDADDKSGKMVLIKVDSGPERLEIDF